VKSVVGWFCPVFDDVDGVGITKVNDSCVPFYFFFVPLAEFDLGSGYFD